QWQNTGQSPVGVPLPLKIEYPDPGSAPGLPRDPAVLHPAEYQTGCCSLPAYGCDRRVDPDSNLQCPDTPGDFPPHPPQARSPDSPVSPADNSVPGSSPGQCCPD